MVTNTNQLDHKDNTALWTVIAIILAAIVAYAIYAASDNRSQMTRDVTASGSTNSMSSTGSGSTSNSSTTR
jgi:hypothetical protein